MKIEAWFRNQWVKYPAPFYSSIDIRNSGYKIAPVDMIAISFDYSYYEVCCPHPNKYISWMLGRVKLLGDLVRDNIINEDKPHHLLGCGLPQEFSFYKNILLW